MKTIETQIQIAASPARVWQVLMQFSAYPDWNPFVRQISGQAKQGARLEVQLAPKPGQVMTFRPVVLACDPQLEFRWKGQLWLPGVFDGEHYFRLVALPNGETLLKHGENFRGVLVPLLGGLLKATEQNFQAMNLALKARAEQTAG